MNQVLEASSPPAWGSKKRQDSKRRQELLVQGAHHILGPFGVDCDLRTLGSETGPSSRQMVFLGSGGVRKRVAACGCRENALSGLLRGKRRRVR